MPSLNDLLQAKSIYASRLLRTALHAEIMSRSVTMRVATAVAAAGKNVHAVGIGKKITEQGQTNELCVRFYVVQKLARSLIPPRDLLPVAIDGVATDVIESPPAFIQ